MLGENPKLFIRTFGCQMNEYDSDKMADVLKYANGLELTENPENAVVLLLNTCSIREKAEQKLFHQLGRWKKLKQQNPDLIIGVGGCVASQEGEAILKRAPFVDVIFGPQTLHRLPNMLNKISENRKISKQKAEIDISFPEIEKFDHLPKPQSSKVSAFVSIMEGCSKYCSFCVVPYTRGEEVSRPLADVIKEVQILASQGVAEVNLLGQNVNSYMGLMDDGQSANLALLVNIIAEIDEIKRIRYTTSHPLEFSDSLIEAYREVPKLVSHLHLPIQSGADRILSLMKRGHTALEYKSKIRKLLKIRPNLSLSSDFIIGFPGETEADFNDTLDLINELNFDKSFSFIYSKRPGTPASSLDDDVSLEVKKQRLSQIQAVINRNTESISKAMTGTVQTVLVENRDKSGSGLYGKTENMRNVHFSGEANLIGKLIDVKITAAKNNSLNGEIYRRKNERN